MDQVAELDVAHQALHLASSRIRKRYEDVPFPDRLSFHTCEHTSGVFRRGMLIAHALRFSSHAQMLVGIACAFHDTVQNWTPAFRENGVVMRVRHAGGNERASAGEALAWMKFHAPCEFNAEDYRVVEEAILATEPDFDREFRTTTQPKLAMSRSPIVHAVALADLGTAGMEGGQYMEGTIQLFAEDNLDIVADIMRARRLADIPETFAKSYQERFISALADSVSWVSGRAIVARPSSSHQLHLGAPVTQLFTTFEQAKALACSVKFEYEQSSFLKIARAIVTNAFPDES